MNTLHVRPRRWARLTRACPLVVGRYRAAFIVRIAFISALPSAHGSKWLPGRTRRARTPRHYVVLSRVIEVSRDKRATMNLAARIRVSSRSRRDARRPNRSRHRWPISLARSFVCSAARQRLWRQNYVQRVCNASYFALFVSRHASQ